MAGKTTSTPKTKTTDAPKAKPRRTAPAKTKLKAIVESTPTPSVKPKAPAFQARTWISVLMLAALIGIAVYLGREKEESITAEITPASVPSFIFNAEDGIVSSIEVKPADGEIVKVERNAENAWVVKMPIEAEADQGLAEAAASQVSALRIISPVDGDPEIFGLENPAFTITIEFQGGKTHILEVGDATLSNSGYYVRVKDKIMVADLNGISSLLQVGYFPPYLNTPTPTALPSTPTPVPATEAVATPTP